MVFRHANQYMNACTNGAARRCSFWVVFSLVSSLGFSIFDSLLYNSTLIFIYIVSSIHWFTAVESTIAVVRRRRMTVQFAGIMNVGDDANGDE